MSALTLAVALTLCHREFYGGALNLDYIELLRTAQDTSRSFE